MAEIEVFGHCPVSHSDIEAAFLRGGAREVRNLPGDFIIRRRSNGEEWVVSSPGGIFPYFFTEQDGKFFHEDTLKAVLDLAGLPWEWCWEAMGDLVSLDQLAGDNTLHSKVKRFPAGGILHIEGERGTLSGQGCQEELLTREEASPDSALEAFNAAVSREAREDCLLSMSGGFDSRAILSSLLKLGLRPGLVCMGRQESTDVAISQRIATGLGLRLELVPLNPRDYLTYGEKIATLTGGAKTAEHWHTYIYLAKAGLPEDKPFFVGVNGEFARSKFIDYGIFVRHLNLPSRTFLRLLWNAMMHNPFSQLELREGLEPRLAVELGTLGAARRFERLTSDCPEELLDALQFQYYTQRVRDFIAYGIRLYDEFVSWRAPFLDRSWIRQAWNMPHTEKLGSNWHRYCIKCNYPTLLRFPITTYLETPSARAPYFYRRPWRRIWKPRVPYAACPAWFSHAEIIDFLLEQLPLIEDLIDQGTALGIIEEHRLHSSRTHAVSWMMAMCMLRRTHG